MRPEGFPEEATLSVEDAARWLGISRNTAYRAAAEGVLPVLRFGRRMRVPTLGLLRLLRGDPEPEMTEALADTSAPADTYFKRTRHVRDSG